LHGDSGSLNPKQPLKELADMELFSKQDPALRKALGEHVNQRWGQLYELEKEWGERALRYLLITNSGGAIATLSFLGASQTALAMQNVRFALVLFVAGIVLVGVLVAKTVHHMSSLFEKWKVDVKSYHLDKITWEHLQSEDEKRAVTRTSDYALAYASFACFIFGAVIGAWNLVFH
jgi:hypothetical protein